MDDDIEREARRVARAIGKANSSKDVAEIVARTIRRERGRCAGLAKLHSQHSTADAIVSTGIWPYYLSIAYKPRKLSDEYESYLGDADPRYTELPSRKPSERETQVFVRFAIRGLHGLFPDGPAQRHSEPARLLVEKGLESDDKA